jgi:hypothetical protein
MVGMASSSRVAGAVRNSRWSVVIGISLWKMIRRKPKATHDFPAELDNHDDPETHPSQITNSAPTPQKYTRVRAVGPEDLFS